jgi:hypothetical protein
MLRRQPSRPSLKITRRNDRPHRVRAIGMLQAAEAICASVGCALPVPHAA